MHNKRTTKKFWDCRHEIFNADLLLFRNGGAIAVAGRGEYTHAAMAGWWFDHLMALELRELRGGRAVTLWSQALKYPGRIDVYRPDLPDALRENAFAAMRGKAGHDYDYYGLLRAACAHLPGVRWFVPAETRDVDPSRLAHPEFCSAAVASAYRMAGRDPVPNLADRLTEPNDLARSPMFSYLFTLAPETN